MPARFICFDLEGPLSPEDNAYELMSSIENGDKVFEAISQYDDFLSLERKRKGYEPGNTLALIVPFLIYHKITERIMVDLANQATLVEGAKELIAWLLDNGWWAGDITTCYQHYGYTITSRLGIPSQNVACTKFKLYEYKLSENDLEKVSRLEQQILSIDYRKEADKLNKILNSFYWGKGASKDIQRLVRIVRPLGGQRKVDVLKKFVDAALGIGKGSAALGDIVVVGDSITDAKMLNVVNSHGGLAVAFNGNAYALSNATIGLASTHLSDLQPILELWQLGGRCKVEEYVRSAEKMGGRGNRNNFHWLADKEDLKEPLEIHGRIRQLVRARAAALG